MLNKVIIGSIYHIYSCLLGIYYNSIKNTSLFLFEQNCWVPQELLVIKLFKINYNIMYRLLLMIKQPDFHKDNNCKIILKLDQFKIHYDNLNMNIF